MQPELIRASQIRNTFSNFGGILKPDDGPLGPRLLPHVPNSTLFLNCTENVCIWCWGHSTVKWRHLLPITWWPCDAAALTFDLSMKILLETFSPAYYIL